MTSYVCAAFQCRSVAPLGQLLKNVGLLFSCNLSIILSLYHTLILTKISNMEYVYFKLLEHRTELLTRMSLEKITVL